MKMIRSASSDGDRIKRTDHKAVVFVMAIILSLVLPKDMEIQKNG